MADKDSSTGAPAEAAGGEAWSRSTDAHVTDFKKDKAPRAAMVGAWALWVVGLALEALAVLLATGSFADVVDLAVWQRLLIGVGLLVIDLVCVLVGTRLWRKVTDARAKARGKKKTGPSVVGVIMACVALVPMVLFFATSKNAGKSTVLAAVISALVAAAALGALAVVL